MTVYWNFREILNVFPDRNLSTNFTCVGITKQNKRCSQRFISNNDRDDAASLLDDMDRCMQLKQSYKYLEQLAFLTLCPRRHREPGYSQVSSVCQRWRLTIEQYEIAIDTQTRQASKLMRNKLRADLQEVKVLVEEVLEEKPKISLLPMSNPSVLRQRDKNVDFAKASPNKDFPEQTSREKSSIIDSISASGSCSNRVASGILTASRTHQPIIGQENRTTNLELQSRSTSSFVRNFSLPSPPDTPETFIQQKKQEKANMFTSTPTKPSRIKDLNQQSRELTTSSALTIFAGIVSVDENSTGKDDSMTNELSHADSSILTQSQKCHVSMTSTEKPSTNGGDVSFNPFTHLSSCLNGPTISVDHEATAPITLPPQTPPQQTAEAFGYALVTPESARYKTYLPSQNRHGLITPPTTPGGVIVKRVVDDTDTNVGVGGVKTPARRTSSVRRKPLPHQIIGNEEAVLDVENMNGKACVKCQSEECRCTEKIEEKSGEKPEMIHEEVKAGCFSGLGRLGKRIGGKLRSFKERLSKTKEA